MRKCAAACLFAAALSVASCAQISPTTDDTKALLAEALWTLQTFKQEPGKHMDAFREALEDAAGVAIFPGAIKAGFILGVEGGSGILIARHPESRKWGQPGFYFLGGVSYGLQIGAQVAEVILVIRKPGAVQALIDHQGKLGADLEITAGPVGAGVEGSITTNLGADVIAFSQAAGLYGGLSVEGAVLAKRTDMNEALYGPGATPRAIVISGTYSSTAADPLRAALAGP